MRSKTRSRGRLLFLEIVAAFSCGCGLLSDEPAPRPTLTSIFPQETAAGGPTGAGLDLIARGTGFTKRSAIHIAGVRLDTSVLYSSTELRAYAAPHEVAAPGVMQVTVVTREPGGGTSNSLPLSVRNTTPVITSLSPASLAVQASGSTLTVDGTGFTARSVVRLDGADRPTRFVGPTRLTTEIAPGDVTTLGSLQVSVFNDGPESGATPPWRLPVYIRRDVVTAAMLADPSRNRLYATIPSTSQESPNSVLVLDPETGRTVTSLFLGNEPSKMGLSDDGQKLYVALDSSSAMVRINTATMTVEKTIPLSRHPSTDAFFADDIVVLPGLPNVVAVARTYGRGAGVSHAGVVVIDDGVERVFGTVESERITAIEPADTGDKLYGYDKYVSSSFPGFRVLSITSSGVTIAHTETGLIRGGDILSQGSRVYSTTGSIVDPVAFRRLADLQVSGPVCVVPGSSRILYATYVGPPPWRLKILAFDGTDFSPAGEISIPEASGLGEFVYAGRDRVALRSYAYLMVFRDTLFGAGAP